MQTTFNGNTTGESFRFEFPDDLIEIASFDFTLLFLVDGEEVESFADVTVFASYTSEVLEFDCLGYESKCSYSARFSAEVQYAGSGGSGYFELSAGVFPFFTVANEAVDTAVTFADLEWSGSDTDGVLNSQELLDHLDSLGSPVIEITFPKAQCGACCIGNYITETQCFDNVAEHICVKEADNDEELMSWRGDGTTCELDGCPGGACCTVSDGCITVLKESMCDNVYVDGDECGTVDCEDYTGACCTEYGCLLTSEAYCTGVLGGTWQGPGTDCDPDPCT
jgi:hypothetical protein